jgi:hypothetical protein
MQWVDRMKIPFKILKNPLDTDWSKLFNKKEKIYTTINKINNNLNNNNNNNNNNIENNLNNNTNNINLEHNLNLNLNSLNLNNKKLQIKPQNKQKHNQGPFIDLKLIENFSKTEFDEIVKNHFFVMDLNSSKNKIN